MGRRADGSVYIDLGDSGLGDTTLVRSDGTPVVYTQLLGLYVERYRTHPWDIFLAVNGRQWSDGHLILDRVLDLLGYEWARCHETVLYGMVRCDNRTLRSRTGVVPTIDGYVRLCGGPAPGRCFIASIGECTHAEGCTRSDRVVVIDTAGEQIAQQHLPPADARFRLRVRSGNYAIELLADGKRVLDRLLQTQGATARAGHTRTVIFNFDVP